MKISPLTIQFENRKTITRKSPHQSVPALTNDTVSFKGNMLHDAYGNLTRVLDTQIIPFMKETKPVYSALVDIQKAVNSVFSKFSAEELNLITKKSNFNQALKTYEPFIMRGEAYKQNINNYNRLKTILSGETYNSDEMKSAIQKADVIMSEENPEFKKIKPFMSRYEETFANIEADNEANILANDNKELYQRLVNLKENVAAKVLFYAFKIPLPEASDLIKHQKEVEKEVKKPTQSLMRTLTELEHLQQSADSIVEKMDSYRQSKDEIGRFISDHKNKKTKFPTSEDVKNAYRALSKKCDESVELHKAKLDEFFEKEYKQKNVDVDFAAVDKFLDAQQKAVEMLSGKKKAIDQKNIDENNRRVLKELGYDNPEFFGD